jgi:hypothetical protein
MYRQHFGLKAAPLDKGSAELWDDGALAHLEERFRWLLHSPGLGLLTGEPGVGKTAALRRLTSALNPHRYQVIYLAETDFGRTDLYRSLALALGVEPAYRRAQLWRDLKACILGVCRTIDSLRMGRADAKILVSPPQPKVSSRDPVVRFVIVPGEMVISPNHLFFTLATSLSPEHASALG